MVQQAVGRIFAGLRERSWTAGDAHRRIREWGRAAGSLPGRMKARPGAARPSRWLQGIGGSRSGPGPLAWALAGAALAVAATAILLYLRKRRQVTAHFTMGAPETAGSGGTPRSSPQEAEAVRT